ncbi:hypothetical protein EGM70_05755 [Enterobacteriaceae bacterium 89]|nr:hypothetical protein [Enterobacteriaceae bacterium 89]
MNDITQRKIKTGTDPRHLADFIALRDEISKLTHPARPDVNWAQVEKLSLALFEHNGVELQTAAWYTLARTHIAAVGGMNEGLAIINAMMSRQWALMWPQPVHSRVEILSGLSQRLQKVFRTLTLTHQDLPALYQSETLLAAVEEVASRHELKQACQLNGLSRQVQQAVTRLENTPRSEENPPAVSLPPQALSAARTEPEHQLVYVVPAEVTANVDVVNETPPAPARWPLFAGGMLTAFALSALGAWGWSAANRTEQTTQALNDSVQAFPAALTTTQLSALQHAAKPPQSADWLKRASDQLDTVAKLPPGWSLRYGNQLLNQAQTLWPNDPKVKQMQQHWQQQVALNSLPENTLTGWHQGMTQLQSLVDKLNALDGQKGKYITVSELKSSVFSMMTNFRQTIPLEEQLRDIREQSSDAQKQVQIQQAEQHLRALTQTLELEK